MEIENYCTASLFFEQGYLSQWGVAEAEAEARKAKRLARLQKQLEKQKSEEA
ncbi:hypothetical protein AB1E22_00415 [Buttiauxella gaviniae]|uniref:Uncharacterized protein n=1 Tax=Buttiauxella gaviniae TaxID=82990 RepID=A0ABV3NNS2_9ENTR